jgi:hypothetical protein
MERSSNFFEIRGTRQCGIDCAATAHRFRECRRISGPRRTTARSDLLLVTAEGKAFLDGVGDLALEFAHAPLVGSGEGGETIL